MTPPDDRDPVDVLAEEFADRLRRGEHPSVSDYAANNPAHADQLRELLPAVAQMEFLKRFRRASGPAEKEELPDRFGDFRIVRELGRGGMGVVFEAVQESLDRPVALKVLATHAQLDDTRRERFVREALAAARLHHTNIVPVFGVGEQDGIPYYVMQLIRGDGLHAILRRWRLEQGKEAEHVGSTVEFGKADTHPDKPAVAAPFAPNPDGPRYGDWAFVAGVGLQAADALHYAHKQGVLHRDVKPANLILDPARRVWVADFGLAKLVNLHGLTATGDILGTLQYLAPECLLGDSDPRSDVYGLGATLYELLTLQPPYAAESPARLVKLVTDTDPPTPRQLNPEIPRDLETIVLKAMTREPRRRYVSPRELAADLKAFLEDRPITARRETWVGRAWRWCRRNPTTSILSTSVVAALLLAGGVGWAGYANTRQALDAEAKRREEAVQAAAKLEANLRLSLEAFEKVFEAAGGTRTGYGTGPWVRPPGPFGPDGPGGPGPGGGGWFLGGFGGPGRAPGGPVVEHKMVFAPGPGGGPGKGPGGPFGEAAADNAAILDALLAFYDKFVEQNATNPRLEFEAAKAHRRVGEMRSWLRQTAQATASLRRAETLLDDLRARYPDREDVRAELVLTVLVRTFASAPRGEFPVGTEKDLLRVLELARTLKEWPRAYLAGSVWFRLGLVREQARDVAGAEEAYRAAVAGLAAPATGDDTRPPPVVGERAFARNALAWLLANTDRLPEARTVLEESVAELRVATDRSAPAPRPPRELLGMALYEFAKVCDRLNDHPAAGAAREEVDALMPRPPGFGGPKKEGIPPPRKK
jgi:serine/threonine protein kinase